MPSFIVPTETVFGRDCGAEVGARAQAAGYRRALLVTDPGVRGAGLTETVEESLRRAGVAYGLFDAVSPNPRDTEAEACASAAGEGGAELLVAVGGGSVIDAAKAAGVLRSNGGRVRDWTAYMGGARPEKPCLPLYALPTTTGTGSETSGGAVITFDFGTAPRKGGLGAAQPELAFLDPALVERLPVALLAASGLDALTHAVESYVSLRASLFTRAFSAQAIRTLATALPAAVTAARAPARIAPPPWRRCSTRRTSPGGRCWAGWGRYTPCPTSPAPTSTPPTGTPTPSCSRRCWPTTRRPSPPCWRKWGPCWARAPSGAGGALEAIARLRESVGAPGRLRDLGVPREALPRLAADAMVPEPVQNPGPAGEADFLSIYERAW